MKFKDQIQISQKASNINLFIYTNTTQLAQIEATINNVQINTFALFGFSMSNQIVIDSNINISIQFYVLTGSLICTICEVSVQRCILVFIASGHQISGLIIEPKESVNIYSSFIQFRISSMNSSGLINQIKQTSVTFIISQCKLSGTNLIQSNNNGYIASTIQVDIVLNISQFDICVDATTRFGQNSVFISIIGSESINCDICNNLSVIYGLCGEELKYSEIVNGVHKCMYPFEYINYQCICAQGYLLDQTKCINIVESINNIIVVNTNNSDHILLIEQKIAKIDDQFEIVGNNMINNKSQIENYIISNYSKSDGNLLINTSILDNRIKANITSLQNNIIQKQLQIDANLLQNTTVLDWRIYNNVSVLNSSIENISQQLKDMNYTKMQNTIDSLQNQLYDFNASLYKDKQVIEQQQNIIDNLTNFINCTNNYGYSMVNGSCVQVSCSISGQQNINGICQCTIINSIVQSGACICPFNSNVISSACVCSITGQTIQNGQCACSTTGAFVNNNACTCGVNSLNISNQCSCPSGASLVNGICTCVNTNAYISGNQCVCPTFSSLVGNTCTCPSNSQIVSNECVCNLISGQVMKNAVCQCQTTGAFVNGGSCTCGVNSLNVSNACSCPSGANLVNGICTCSNINAYISGNQCVCPTYSSLVENTCTCPANSQILNNSCICNQISGQIMNNGLCQCQTTGAIVNNGACICGVNATNVSNICTCPSGATLVNGVCTCQNINAYISGNQCVCPTFSSLVGNTCTCPTNSSLINSVCTCDKIIGQTMINGTCQCPSNQPIINNQCDSTSYLIKTTNFECSQQYFTQSFDLQSVNYQITAFSNFSQGYVFRSGQVTQNAFIDIQDNVYNINYNVRPLFSNENILTNFKIQFGTQSLNNGSFILDSIQTLSINQMNIITKQGSQLTLKASCQLNILSNMTNNMNISNLLVNLSFAPSSGNITLLCNIAGNFNISGYQVLGSYISTQTVAMIGLNVYQAVVNVNKVSFKTSAFNVGNGSSYLFGETTYLSTLVINNLAVILGNISSFLLLGSITSDSTNYYQFGGLIAILSVQSTLYANNILMDSYQYISTSNVTKSGFLVGQSLSIPSVVNIKNLCLQQNSTSLTQQFQNLGLVGYTEGNTSFSSTTITFSVQGTNFNGFGIIGNQSTSIFAEFINLRTSVTVASSTSSSFIGSVFGIEQAETCSIQNASVVQANIISGQYTGGFIAYSQQSKVTIQNSTISQVNISGSDCVGGFIGYYLPYNYVKTFYLVNSNIQSVRISGSTSYISIVVGYSSGGTFQISGSSSASNYIKAIKQNDCGALSNNWSVVGC
ncbi:Conserved_hypothetical protein [Hexamita inflata]|uniref:Uncharacterized protein n=1 Tax=Hexamita inflata TaxID=28002 RepID=A0AA86NUA4_9EUKA|nr:Conserved hypothetical protein [Hexamita inflata]